MAVTSWICLVFAVAKMNASACFDPRHLVASTSRLKANHKKLAVRCVASQMTHQTKHKVQGIVGICFCHCWFQDRPC